ncbi:hypothetical protein HS7_09860 [Sulfolobales archaeon HS-7]|nr:hypothetical protein HS7_09860 [Sulfolobales archaeon HS-7]
MKGVSEVLGSIITLAVLLALLSPLLYYFFSYTNITSVAINNDISIDRSAILTCLSIIVLGNTSSEVFLYNYGNIEIHITRVVLNDRLLTTDYTIQPHNIVRLSSMIGDMKISTPIIIYANNIIISSN